MECEVELQGGDLHAGVVTEPNSLGFSTMEDAHTLAVAEREMWLNSDQDEFLGVNEASMFYADFPPLPDFPCMSSSSSSSSAPPLPVKTMTCSTTTTTTTTTSSSSSSSSWAMLKSDFEEDAEKNHCNPYMHDHLDATALSSTASMEVFLEWLKSNKDSVSANDLRNVKLKKATIESAARRLGGGKEAMKQLLKLILEWVQTSHLQNKRRKENNGSINTALQAQFQDPGGQNNQTTQTASFAPESNSCFSNNTPWLSPQAFGTDQAPIMQFPQHMVGQSFGENGIFPNGGFGGYGNNNQYPYQFFHGPGDRLMRLGPSATKEARKKRMARQRRFMTHHRHHNSNNHQNNHGSDPRLGSDNCTTVMAAPHANPAANWMYWQAMTGGTAGPLAPVAPAESPAADRSAMQTQNGHQGRAASDRRQGWKPEKNLRFLLQKVLKQSDVGSLGRIVLPKKEAETHLPELEARDGISITMEDIGTSRVWNMRYRYWPNNKSRMYLLENTGDFVRANGLQEGDFIVIYSDVKCGKYMIRGVKVRQQGLKPETKKAGKSQKNQHGTNAATTAVTAANNGTPSSPKQKAEKK
uniref:B3 domain-containing transcription factor ABI3 n=1 Tax=Cajanus cajan TaxID=3821 RepID=A0A151SI77_CAJCA|nr:B3 domain-containing transcription factor ABI3 [Cajanus cajan]